MIKPDDCSLTPDQYKKVKDEAIRALTQAEALGVFPTPIEDIMAAANIEEVKEDVLNESFITKLRKEAGSALRRAVKKVIGLFDARSGLVFIDQSLMAVKKTYVRLHETGHAFMAWQRQMYAVVEDCESTLSPDVAELFDKEANVFASEVLFQGDAFINESFGDDFGIKVPMRLSKKYGASVYASIRQYVSKNHRACTVIVLNPPELIPGDGFRANLRRVISSASFEEQFGILNWPEYFTPDDDVGAMVPLHKRRMSGKKSLSLTDINGTKHEFVGEAFTNTYQVFILIVSSRALTTTNFILGTP
ncbi:MAG: ImmA/IrrE family metallo-endopeptidase [Gammaproteobacteria bacterium]|nr:ImmA/IrrE family metallo-endopeptidase [Gammaproteobacteria bacterium]MBL4890309.1 ImmA/IrrE family metallo-endopeptidase [Rhizobiaceae bacterium]